MKFYLICLYFLFSLQTYGATKNDSHSPITHCYHWIDEGNNGYLTHKYEYAKKNQNELTFHTTPGTSNGAVAGAGLYCAKSPSGSYSYGDRLIRIELVEDVVLYDSQNYIKYCGTNGVTSNNSEDCANKVWDIKFYSGGGEGNYAWYVIQNPMAIESWSANSDQIIWDLKASTAINDVQFQNHAHATIERLSIDRSENGERHFYNLNSRQSIASIILSDPGKLDSIPPLNILERLSIIKSEVLSDELKNEVFKKYLFRSLSSPRVNREELIAITSKYPVLLNLTTKLANENITELMKKNPFTMIRLSQIEAYHLKVSDKIIEREVLLALKNKKDLDQVLTVAGKLSDRSKNKIKSKLVKDIEGTKVEDKEFTKFYQIYTEVASSEELNKVNNKILKGVFYQNDTRFFISFGSLKLKLLESSYSDHTCNVMFSASGGVNDLKITISEQEFLLKSAVQNKSELCDFLNRLIEDNDNLHANISQADIETFYVHGDFEGIKFSYLVQDIESLTPLCNQQFIKFTSEVGNSQIDEIHIGHNNLAEARKYNESSYWTSADMVCGKIEKHFIGIIPTKLELKAKKDYLNAKKSFIPRHSSHKLHSVSGTIQGSEYYFFGDTVDKINTQCLDYFTHSGKEVLVDSIYVSHDFNSAVHLYNSSSYWKSSPQACGQILNAIKDKVPSKEFLKELEAYDRVKSLPDFTDYHIVRGQIQGESYIFYGKYFEDISKMCSEHSSVNVANVRVDLIMVKVDENAQKRLYNSSSYWKSREAICRELLAATTDVIPFEVDLKHTAEFLKKKDEYTKGGSDFYTIQGDVESIPFSFIGKYSDDILDQCIAYYEVRHKTTGASYITAIANEDIKTHVRFYSYGYDAQSVCQSLMSHFSGSVLTKKETIRQAKRKEIILDLLSTHHKEFVTSKSSFKIPVRMNYYEFNLFGEFTDDLQIQCKQFHNAIYDNIKFDYIGYTLASGEEVSATDLKSDSYSVDEFCYLLIEDKISSSYGIISIEDHERKLYLARIKKEFLIKNSKLEEYFENGEDNYRFKISQGDQVIYLSGNNAEEVLKMLSEVKSHSLLMKFESIQIESFSNGKFFQDQVSEYNSSRFFIILEKSIGSTIPTRREVKYLADLLELDMKAIESDAPYKIDLTVMSKQMRIAAETSRDVLSGCEEYQTHYNLDGATEFEYTYKDKSYKVPLGRGDSICEQIMEQLYSIVPPDELKQMKDLYDHTNDDYRVSGMFGKVPFYFTGNSPKDFERSCKDHYSQLAELNKGKPLEFKWSVANNSKVYSIKSKSTLRRSRSLCRLFSRTLKKQFR